MVEGDDDKLKWFEEAIDIKNTLIKVSFIEKDILHPKEISSTSTRLWGPERPIPG